LEEVGRHLDEQTRGDAQESLVRVGADALAAQITRPWSRHKSSEFTHGHGALLRAQRFRAAATHRCDQLARRQQGYDRADRERLGHGAQLELAHENENKLRRDIKKDRAAHEKIVMRDRDKVHRASCLGVRGPGIAELRSVASRVAS
jgi:hypothetical protein